MRIIRCISSLACASILAGCASIGPQEAPKLAHVTLDSALAEADVAVKTGQGEKAIQILKSAAAAHPAEKTPWLQMAQLRFDSGSYGDAIVNALEGLQRDPDDKLGHSIIAVSGLRLSSKALADLSQKNNLSGTVRSEAQDLAKLLRASLGEEVLVPAKAAPKPVIKKQTSTTGKAAASNDPFGALK